MKQGTVAWATYIPGGGEGDFMRWTKAHTVNPEQVDHTLCGLRIPDHNHVADMSDYGDGWCRKCDLSKKT